MKSDLIRSLTDTFEAHAQETESGIEFWLARISSTCCAMPDGITSSLLFPGQKLPAKSPSMRFPTILPVSGKWSIWAPVASGRMGAGLSETTRINDKIKIFFAEIVRIGGGR
jgi:hypothetical protein